MAVFLRKLMSCIVKEAVPATCQKACPMNGRRNQEDHQCHGCQSRVDAEGQTKAPNYFNGSGTQHEPGDQAGGCAMFDECFRSHGLANDSETIQQKYDCDENTRKD